MYCTDLSILKEKGLNIFAHPYILFNTIKKIYMYIKFYTKIHIYRKLFIKFTSEFGIPVCYILLKGVIQDLNL